MKNKITLKEFFESKEKLAIHCDTEEKANKLLKEFDKFSIFYLIKKSKKYRDKICYANDGFYNIVEFHKEENYKIYSFEDIIFEENNLIPFIAEKLGVEIGQRFKVDATSGVFYFDNEYIHLEIDNEEDIYFANRKSKATLEELLNGHWKITERLLKKPQLTDAERVILENLPKEYEWITRDKYGELTVFESKPFKEECVIFWRWHDGYTLSLKAFKHLFQFIKWDDQEAYNIGELLKGE